MPMPRRLLAFGLFAVLPALACAQEPKLVNCRTLEAAGNFVGPDEVIVDDMVCQKAKHGTDAATKTQTQKQVIGTVISDVSTDSVVDAAKAAEKRVAVRREQEAAKNAVVPPSVSTVPAAPASNASPTAASVSAPPAPSVAATPPPPAPRPEVAPAPQSAAPTSVSSAKTEVAVPEESSPLPTAPNPKSETATPAESVSAPATTTSVAPATAESPSPSEIVISLATASASSAPAPAEQPAAVPASAPAPAEPAPAPPPEPIATTSAPSAEVAPVDATHPATSNGFYDANAPKHGANAGPQANTGFASADQVNAGLTPGATSIPQSAPPAATDSASTAAAAAPETEPQHTTIAASRIDFDADRDRSVKLGDFAKPHEVSPDPNAQHRTSVDPSDADGFQDRQRPDCTKNITLAGLNGEKLVLGVPRWAAKWIEKNENRMPQVCFSETPMKNARNYLIVFSTPAGQVSKEAADAAVNPAKGTGAAGVGTFTTLYGSTWHYSFDRNVGTTILTQDDADEPHGAPGQVLYATAYTEEGVPVAQRWPGQVKKEIKANEKNPKKLKGETEALEHVSSDLLSQMVEDIEKL